MPARLRKPPSYRLHKPTGQAVVRIDGRDFYLGRHGTDASHEAYRRIIAEWATAPTPATTNASRSTVGVDLTINQLMVAFWDRHVLVYYVKNGRPTSERDNIRQALRFLRRLYGSLPSRDFGPQALKAVRQAMVDAGRCRGLVNKDINRIRGMFRWAVEHELLPVTIYQALQAVAGLLRGRSEAREAPPIAPVPEADVVAILPHLSPQVAAMIRLQLLTGARPGEVAAIRPRDVAVADGTCIYRPAEHKTEHHGRDRVIYLGPRAQEVLRPWLEREADSYCFVPAEVVEARNARARAGRRSPMTPSQAGRVRKAAPRRAPGSLYGRNAYRVAIRRACVAAGVPIWTPLQLRHNAATAIRTRFGLEAAQVILGHAKADTTEVYAEKDAGLARRVAAEFG